MPTQDLNYDQQLARLLVSQDVDTFERLRQLAREAHVDLHTVLAHAVRFAADAGERRTVACWACEQDRPDNILPCPTCHRPWSPG